MINMNFVDEVKRFQNTKLNMLLMKHFNTLYNDFEVIEFNVDELDNDIVEFVKKINEYNKTYNDDLVYNYRGMGIYFVESENKIWMEDLFSILFERD
jgi:chaperonin cofactor prefoldin